MEVFRIGYFAGEMRNLVIDIGNTRIKSALFESNTLLEEQVFENLDQGREYWSGVKFDHCLISSVRIDQAQLREALSFPFQFLNHQTAIPLINAYSTPHTLGLDRICAAVGAWELAGRTPVLAIDLGTCITYELVDDRGVYLGGAISPGLVMRAKAMHQFTAKLPEVAVPQSDVPDVGDSTQSSLQVGIRKGVEFEMKGFMEAYSLKFPEIKVFICGGDAQSFESIAKDHIFVVPNLVLYGLNSILNHNVE